MNDEDENQEEPACFKRNWGFGDSWGFDATLTRHDDKELEKPWMFKAFEPGYNRCMPTEKEWRNQIDEVIRRISAQPRCFPCLALRGHRSGCDFFEPWNAIDDLGLLLFGVNPDLIHAIAPSDENRHLNNLAVIYYGVPLKLFTSDIIIEELERLRDILPVNLASHIQRRLVTA